MTPTLRGWWVVASLWTLSGCLCGYPQTVVGNGVPESQSRTVGAFRVARFEGGTVGTVLTGARNVKVTADANLLEYIETYVESGDVFVARTRPGSELAPVVGLKVEVFNEVLEGLEVASGSRATAQATPVGTFPLKLSGGATGTVTGVASTRLEVTAGGAAMATASGAATTVAVTSSDASVVDVQDVVATDVSLTVSGSSKVVVRATGAVTGSLTGASHLVVYGGGTVTVDTSADSTIEER